MDLMDSKQFSQNEKQAMLHCLLISLAGDHINCVFFNEEGDVVGLDNLQLTIDGNTIVISSEFLLPGDAEMMAFLDSNGVEVIRRSVTSYFVAEIV